MQAVLALLEALADVLTPIFKFIVWIWPIKIYWLHDGQRGVICTFGKVRRKNAERGPGITVAWPFEEMTTTQAKGLYLDIDDQEVVLMDGRLLTVNGAMWYNIVNVQKAVLELKNREGPMSGVFLDRLRKYTRKLTWEALVDGDDLIIELVDKLNKRFNSHGIVVYEILMTDCRLDDVQMYCDTIEETVDKLIDFCNEKLNRSFWFSKEKEVEKCVSI